MPPHGKPLLRGLAVLTTSLWYAGYTVAGPAIPEHGSSNVDDPATAVEGPVFATPTRLDRIGRIVAPVTINGQGPFRFIVDSGASRSAISAGLAARLGLTLDPTRQITVKGVTGSQAVPSVPIAYLQAGDLTLEDQRLPVLADFVFADTDGILGVEGLAGMCLLVDFQYDRLSITRKRPKHLKGQWSHVPVQLRFGQLMVATARIGGTRVEAVIDTGAERTLGNLALRRALGLDVAAQTASTQRWVLGATSATEQGNSIPSPAIRIGEAGIRRLEITFGDLNVFRLWGLEDRPALVLGMDVLGTTQGLLLDYGRRELLVRL